MKRDSILEEKEISNKRKRQEWVSGDGDSKRRKEEQRESSPQNKRVNLTCALSRFLRAFCSVVVNLKRSMNNKEFNEESETAV